MLESRAPPLAAWLVTGIVTAGVGIVLLLAPLPSHAPKQASMNLQRVSSHLADSPQIVALGSSKIMYALSFDSSFATQVKIFPAVQFTRLTWLGPKTDDMLEPLEHLRQAPPSVLLLEADLLESDHAAARGFYSIAQGMRFSLRRLLLHQSPEAVTDAQNALDNRGHETFSARGECRWMQNSQHQREYSERGLDRRIISAAEANRYFAVLQQLKSAGTQVILLDVPRAPWAEAPLSPSLRDAYRTQWRKLIDQEGYLGWAPPIGLLSDAEFCDAGHLTEDGRRRFEHWLAERLTAYVKSLHE